MPPATLLLAGLALLGVAACGDDDAGSGTATTTTTAATTTTGSAGGDVVPPDACTLVPDAAAVSGLDLGEPAPDGDERRRVCAFAAREPGQVGLTVAVQGGDRFDEKAEQSESIVGPGDPVEGIGDRALFFFADDDIPEGVGGMLVAVGDLTIEVTLQGIGEDAMREAATALADLATANLHS